MTARAASAREVGSARIFDLINRARGSEALSLRILRFQTGVSPAFLTPGCGDVLYLVAGAAKLVVDGGEFEVGSDTGIFLRPGSVWSLENTGSEDVVLVSSQCPDPESSQQRASGPATQTREASELASVRLADRMRATTADRWYKVMVDRALGSDEVTQFVGAIPPGRAPDHFHEYEEAIYILAGEGQMWAGNTHTPVAPGSVIFLPRRQVHCLENTGESELRLLGVFYPAGSPAVRYEPEPGVS